MSNVAEVFVASLENAGIKRIYGIVGDSLNGITNALAARNMIGWIHVRHEEAGAFAAGAEAQLTGELTVCAGSCGPGNTHLINGLYDAHRSRAPVLAIAAHIPTPEIGGDYFQETNPNLIFKDCSCFCETVDSPEHMPRLLKIAMQTAIAKNGVAVLIISGDMALSKASHPPLTYWQPMPKPRVTPDLPLLTDIANRLNKTSKITIFAGIGCADAHASLIALSNTLKAPIVHTLRGKPYVEYDNPNDVGMTGLIGFSSGYYAMESCDTLLLLGTSFPYRQFYPEHAEIIQIDINGEQLGKRTNVTVGAIGDVDDTIQALLPLLNAKTDGAFLDKARTHYVKAREGLDKLACASGSNQRLHPQYVAKCIDIAAADDAVFTSDVGTPTVWAARYLKMNGKRRHLGSFNHGSMANALSQAIGVQATFPKRQVIAMCGDGGFSMLMGDILTLVQHKLPIKVVIFNNGTLGFVEMEMHIGGMLDYATTLVNPNFAALAEAAGIKGIRVEQSADMAQALTEAMSHPGPVIIDALVNRNELIMPPKIELGQVKGFSLYMMKAILNGQGDAILDLMKTNLWRSE